MPGPIGSLSDLRAALWRRLWLIVLILAVGLPAVVLVVKERPRAYEATAVIQVEMPEVTVSTSGQASGLSANAQLDLVTQHLMARGNIERMIADFGLFDALPSATERVAALRLAVTTRKIVDPAQAWRPDVQPTGLSITVRLDDPEKAAGVANALLDSIIREAQERAEGRAARTLEFLVSEETRVSDQIAALEGRIADFRTAHVDSLPEGLTAQRDHLNELTRSRLALEQQRIELQGASGRLRPEDAAAQERLLAEQIDLVATDIARVEAAIAAAPEVERQLTAQTRSLDQLEAQLTVLTTQRTEAATAELLSSREQVERFSVLERAEVPDYAVSMSRAKLALAGGVAVVVLALALALALEIMQPAIRNARQMERLLGVQPVIVVPLLRSTRARRRRRVGAGLGIGAIVAAVAALAALWGRGGLRRVAPVPVMAGRQ
ncbi:MAG: chain-length determining protein [Rubellimicrobium sp.]|nr:chain-length determining protein [Rubellimicrobium sp.]